MPPKGSEKEIAHLLLKTGTDTVDVYLCPQFFLVDMRLWKVLQTQNILAKREDPIAGNQKTCTATEKQFLEPQRNSRKPYKIERSV